MLYTNNNDITIKDINPSTYTSVKQASSTLPITMITDGLQNTTQNTSSNTTQNTSSNTTHSNMNPLSNTIPTNLYKYEPQADRDVCEAFELCKSALPPTANKKDIAAILHIHKYLHILLQYCCDKITKSEYILGYITSYDKLYNIFDKLQIKRNNDTDYIIDKLYDSLAQIYQSSEDSRDLATAYFAQISYQNKNMHGNYPDIKIQIILSNNQDSRNQLLIKKSN